MSSQVKNSDDYSLLSDKRIMGHIRKGNIVISPFQKMNLGTCSYDVTLGEYYFREQIPPEGKIIYSPWSKIETKRAWGEPHRAVIAERHMKLVGMDIPDGIFPDDKIILIPSGETFLCHTREFIGGRNVITTMMKASGTVQRRV